MGIIKIEGIEGNPDIVYRNPYGQFVACADSAERLKLPDVATNCFILGKDETVCLHAKYVYLAVPDKY